MRDVTSNIQVAKAAGDAYDLNGFESVMGIFAAATAYDASAIKVSAGDDADSMEELAADSPAVIVRFDSEGTIAKVGYIGGRRYISFAGGTPTAVLLVNPCISPVGEIENPDGDSAASGDVRMRKTATQAARSSTGTIPTV